MALWSDSSAWHVLVPLLAHRPPCQHSTVGSMAQNLPKERAVVFPVFTVIPAMSPEHNCLFNPPPNPLRMMLW